MELIFNIPALRARFFQKGLITGNEQLELISLIIKSMAKSVYVSPYEAADVDVPLEKGQHEAPKFLQRLTSKSKDLASVFEAIFNAFPTAFKETSVLFKLDKSSDPVSVFKVDCKNDVALNKCLAGSGKTILVAPSICSYTSKSQPLTESQLRERCSSWNRSTKVENKPVTNFAHCSRKRRTESVRI